MLPGRHLDDPRVVHHTLVVGVLALSAATSAARAVTLGRALVASGADVLDVCLLDPTSPGGAEVGNDLLDLHREALSRAGLPVCVSVSDAGEVRRAVGDGAAMLRADRASTRPSDLAAAVGGAGLPAIVPSGFGSAPNAASATPGTAPGGRSDGRVLVQVDLAAFCAGVARLHPLVDGSTALACPTGVNTSIIADIDAVVATDRGTVAAQVCLAHLAGVRAFRTPDPAPVRRVIHVLTAIEQAG